MTYSCSAEGLCLGFAHNLYHPQLRRFVCDRAIYISQLSYSLGSVKQSSQESSTTNRFDGFQITCEQYYVGGPTGRKEKYESIVFIQYISELLKIIETLDQKSSTLLFSPVNAQNGVDSVDDVCDEVYDLDNVHTFKKMFSHKVSSRGRTIQLSSKIDGNIGKSTDLAASDALANHTRLLASNDTSDATGHFDTITISDADGNFLAHIQDPSLALEVVSPEEKTDEAKENTLMPTLVPPPRS